MFTKDNIFFQQLKDTFLQSVKKYLERDIKINYLVAWGYRNLKKQEMLETVWHHHSLRIYNRNKNNDYDNITELSGLFYLNHTELGTEIDNEHFTLKIKPKLHTWYLWPAEALHRPEPGISNNNRYTIATTIGVYNE